MAFTITPSIYLYLQTSVRSRGPVPISLIMPSCTQLLQSKLTYCHLFTQELSLLRTSVKKVHLQLLTIVTLPQAPSRNLQAILCTCHLHLISVCGQEQTKDSATCSKSRITCQSFSYMNSGVLDACRQRTIQKTESNLHFGFTLQSIQFNLLIQSTTSTYQYQYSLQEL